MKKQLIVGTALALGILSIGALSASATTTCCNGSKCADQQAVQQFTRESAALTDALRAKNIELREQNSLEGIDPGKISTLEAELNALQEKLEVVAEKFGIKPCCLG